MNNNQERKKRTDRQNWMAIEGFLLYTDVQGKILKYMEGKVPVKLEPQILHRGSFRFDLGPITPAAAADSNPAGASLLAATHSIIDLVPKVIEPDPTGKVFYETYGITKKDLDDSDKFTTSNGFANLNFTPLFAAAIANEVVDAFIAEGHITPEQKAQFSLYDWANIIRRIWFSALIADMAFAKNNTYGPYGSFLKNYVGYGVVQRLQERNYLSKDWEGKPFVVSLVHDDQDGNTYLTATLNSEIHDALRESMRRAKRGSAGCPVPRRSVTVDSSDLNNPHIQSLINSGTLVVSRVSKGKIQLSQERTAIDDTLALFAYHLDVYAGNYGTPHISGSSRDKLNTIIHKDIPLHPNFLMGKS